MPRAYYDRGALYRHVGEADKALADFRKALSLRPLYIDALYGVADVLSSKGDYENSLAACTKITEVDRFDERGYRCLAEQYIKQNQTDQALKTYQKATTLMPDSITVWKELASLYERLGMSAEANAAHERASSNLRRSR